MDRWKPNLRRIENARTREFVHSEREWGLPT